MNNKISALVIAHNEEPRIRACLSSIFCQVRQPDEIVVIAHNCTDGTERIIKNDFPSVRLVPYHGPHGTIFARMRAFEEASNEILVCLDGDCRADPYWARELTGPLYDPSVSAVTNTTLYHGNTFVWLGSRFYYYAVQGCLNSYLSFIFPKVREFAFWGTSFALRKSDIEAVGGLEPMLQIKPHLTSHEWHEDYYLSHMLRAKGRIVVTSKTVVHTISKQRTSLESIRRFLLQQTNEKRILEAIKKRSPDIFSQALRSSPTLPL